MKQFLTADEAADYLRISHQRLCGKLKRGEIKAYRAKGSRKWLVDPESLEDFLQSNQEEIPH